MVLNDFKRVLDTPVQPMRADQWSKVILIILKQFGGVYTKKPKPQPEKLKTAKKPKVWFFKQF